MRSDAAKKMAAAVGATFAYDKGAKLYLLTLGEQSTDIGSENLKAMSKEDFEDELAGLQAQNNGVDGEGMAIEPEAEPEPEAEAEDKVTFPKGIRWGKGVKKGETITVTLPNGDTIDGMLGKAWFFFEYNGGTKCGPVSMVKDGAVDLSK